MGPRNLHHRRIGKLGPRDGRGASYPDHVVPGLELVVTPRGVRTWSLRAYLAGHRIRVKIERYEKLPDLGKARERARKILELVGAGVDPRPTRGRAATVTALAELVLEALELRPKTRREWERLLRTEIEAPLGGVGAGRLDRDGVRRWVSGIKKRSVARAAFAFLRRCYSWGVEAGVVTTSPFYGLRAPEASPSSERVLSTEEVAALWIALGVVEKASPLSADATRLLLLTAARRGMVIGMRADEFESMDENPRWIIPGSRMKGGRDHVVPLSPQAVVIVRRRLEASRDGLLFPATYGAEGAMVWASRFVRRLKSTVNAILGRAAPPWRIHNLRHTVATHMVEDLGVATDLIPLLLSHRGREPVVTHIYLRAERLDERRDALCRWADWVERIVL